MFLTYVNDDIERRSMYQNVQFFSGVRHSLGGAFSHSWLCKSIYSHWML